MLWDFSVVSSLSWYSILLQHACNDLARLTSECSARYDNFCTVWCTLSWLETLRDGNPLYFLILKYHKMVILETYLSLRPFCCNQNIAHLGRNKTKQITLKFVESVSSFHELMRPFDWLIMTTTLTKMLFDPDFVVPEVAAWQIWICDCWEFNDFPLLQSNQVKRTPQEYINEFIIQKLNPLLVVDFRLISAFLHV